MTKTEIIEETAAFYNSNNRARTTVGGCAYLTSDGRKCAVGRCMTEESSCVHGGNPSFVSGLSQKVGGLDNILEEKYQGHELKFWKDLQSFHDCSEFWNSEGLSEDGKEFKTGLLTRWGA